MVNFIILSNVVLTSSKIIRHFKNSQLIFTWHKMASMCSKFHCHTISTLENTRVGHFCPPLQIKYATPDTPDKIGLIEYGKICSNRSLLNYLAKQKRNNMPNKVFVNKGCECDYNNPLRKKRETRKQY